MKNICPKSLSKIAVCGLSILLLLPLSGCKSQDYEKAVGYFHEGKLEAAEMLFEELEGYEDSQDYLTEIQTMQNYHKAVRLFNEGSYEESETLFKSLNGYEDSQAYLEQMGFCKFFKYIKDKDVLRLKCQDSLAPYDIVLSTIGNTIEAKFILDLDTGTQVSSYIEYTVYLEQGKENVKLVAHSDLNLLSAVWSDEASTIWDIGSYREKEDAPSWNEYHTDAMGTTIHGDPLEKNNNLGSCKENSGSHETSVKRLADGIRWALKESGLSTTMADLGFTSYEE